MNTVRIKTLTLSIALIGVIGGLAGCATTPETARHEPALADWPTQLAHTPARDAQRDAALEWPPEPQPGEAAPGVAAAEEPALPTEVIGDLDLTGVTDIPTVLRALAKAADVNMLISPQAAGEVHFTFHDVPWDQAFRSVLAAGGLTYEWEGDILRVMTAADLRREMEIETARKDREDVRAELRMVEPLVMQVYPIRYARAKGLGETVRGVLTGRQAEGGVSRASVMIDEENNALILHAHRENLKKAAALINQLDQPKAQIHLEARIVEATRDTARQLGVQWGGAYATIGGERAYTLGGAGLAAGGYISDFPAQFAQGVAPDAGFSLGFLSEKLNGSEWLNVQLTALQRSGKIEILSSPSITTMDNEQAIIESGEERAYRVTTGTGNILDVSLEWKKAVLKLEVTPHVVDGEYLRVDIRANKDSFDETRPQTNNEFPVNTKHASTTVLLRNGQTVVIGGLSQESSSNARTGIPFLMDIPVLGHLFRNNGTSARFDDTLIFITPRILGSGMVAANEN